MSVSRRLLRVVLVCAATLASECAIHAPMSETVIFHDEGATRPAHDGTFGFGVSAASVVTETDSLEEEARRRYRSEVAAANFIKPQNLRKRGMGVT